MWEDVGRCGGRFGKCGELRPIRHLHPAVLEHVRVRVEDWDAIGLVPRENLAQPLVGGLPSLALWPEQRERGEARAASEVDHLEVRTYLFRRTN